MSRDIIFTPDEIGNTESVYESLCRRYNPGKGRKLHIAKSFIDARHKDRIKVIYRVEVMSPSEEERLYSEDRNKALPHINDHVSKGSVPVVVGFGPAGMFAALVLAEYGMEPLIIERGSMIDKRVKDVDNVRNGSDIDPESNVQFGEGGAGTFSDGKLYTGVTSGLIAYIAKVMTDNGADPSVMYDSHPHVGTDRLRTVVKGIREKIISLGGRFMFDTAVKGIRVTDGRISAVCTDKGDIDTDNVILAIGHSSRDTLRMLSANGIAMESKPFAVGVRIEHLRECIDNSQYGFDTSDYRNISAASYKLACDTVTGRKLYTFCMCPGGEVIAAQSASETICTNGMSWSGRDMVNSNSALLVPIDQNDYGSGILDGMFFQERLEHRAYVATGSTGKAPYLYYGDMSGDSARITHSVKPSFMPGTVHTDINDIFDGYIIDTINDGIRSMGRKLKGFDSPDAVITMPEARSSSPVRILRDRERHVSLSVDGLYPCGEGAGYAGGIMSSAIDGIKCANSLVENMLN